MTTSLAHYPPAPEDTVVTEYGPFQLTATGVTLVAEPSFEEWLHTINWVKAVDGAVQFWLGDLIEIGERKWGEKYTQALDMTEYAEKTLRNATYVARHVPIGRRRPPQRVSFAHHAEVAPLPPEEQVQWLDRCEQEGWTREKLRSAIKQAKAGTTGVEPSWILVVRCTSAADQETLAERLRQEGRTVTLR